MLGFANSSSDCDFTSTIDGRVPSRGCWMMQSICPTIFSLGVNCTTVSRCLSVTAYPCAFSHPIPTSSALCPPSNTSATLPGSAPLYGSSSCLAAASALVHEPREEARYRTSSPSTTTAGRLATASTPSSSNAHPIFLILFILVIPVFLFCRLSRSPLPFRMSGPQLQYPFLLRRLVGFLRTGYDSLGGEDGEQPSQGFGGSGLALHYGPGVELPPIHRCTPAEPLLQHVLGRSSRAALAVQPYPHRLAMRLRVLLNRLQLPVQYALPATTTGRRWKLIVYHQLIVDVSHPCPLKL